MNQEAVLKLQCWTVQQWKKVERDLRSSAASDSQHCGLSLFETPFSVLAINNDLKISIKMGCKLHASLC